MLRLCVCVVRTVTRITHYKQYRVPACVFVRASVRGARLEQDERARTRFLLRVAVRVHVAFH